MKKINLFIVSLFFFSFSIFFVKDYFLGLSQNKINENIEEKYIEPSIDKKEYLYETTNVKQENIKISLKSAYNIDYIFYPQDLEESIDDYLNSFKTFLNNKTIISKIDNLKVEFFKDKNDIRGKMKNHTIKLYGIEKMSVSECNSVGIHEFGHFIDLYFLKKEVFTDLSDYFYTVSWESTKVMKGGQKQSDFVSGYAMTNKYEDFAESFTYFILHNEDFLVKSKESILLKKKYDFFVQYLFKDKSFVGTDFSIKNKVELYYRDITKINFSLKNFLAFLKK